MIGALGITGLITIALVIVNFAKEKFVTGVVGFFFVPVALVGAVRLAKEHSVWARLFYRDEKKARARRRLEHERAPFERLRARDQSPAGPG